MGHRRQSRFQCWKETGISKPTEEIFARISDNGSNMISGWQEGFQTPCADHTLELSVKLYTEHPDLAPTFDKGRGLVGYFNRSVVGYNEEGSGCTFARRHQARLRKSWFKTSRQDGAVPMP